MTKIKISKKISRLDDYIHLKDAFGTGYLRQIDKFLTINRPGCIYLANSFYINNVLKIEDPALLAVLDCFSQPLPFLLFIHTLCQRSNINAASPTTHDLKKISDLLKFAVLLYKNKFIVYEYFNEYAQLKKFREHALSNRYPSCVYIITSLDCNFRCPNCFIYDGNWGEKKTKYLSPGVFDKQFKFALKHLPKKKDNEISFLFYGGEPLLNKEMVKYAVRKIRRLQKKGSFGKAQITISTVTNGSLVDEDIARFFKRHNVSVGVSLDGIGSVNDIQRVFKDGSSTFAATVRGIQTLKKHNIQLGLSCTVGPDNLDTMCDYVEWAFKELGLTDIFLNFMKGSPSVGDPFKKIKTATLYNKLHKIYDKIAELGLVEGRLKRYAGIPQHGMSQYLYYCAAVGGGQFVLRPDGKIGLCHAGMMKDEEQFQTAQQIGDVDKDSTWLNWLARTPVFMKDCYLLCDHFSRCPGGCAYRDEQLTGDLYSVHDETCKIEKFLVERGIIECYDRESVMEPRLGLKTKCK